jgi:TrpR-related protein YerC/YecD
LFSAVLKLRNIAECRAFFRDLCTPAELQAMKDRWAVAELLTENLTYRDIHNRTGVSVTTIGRVARCLADDPPGYAAVLKRMGKS